MAVFTKFSLRNPVVILVLSLLIMVGGIFSTTKFKQEQMPDIALPMVTVTAVYPGASSNEMLNEVTVPLEKALRNVEGVKNVISQSSNGFVAFQLEFDFNDNIQEKVTKTEEIIKQVHLPQGVETPKVSKFSYGSQPVYYSSIVATDNMSSEELNSTVQKKVIPELENINGVAKVNTYGLKQEGIFLQFDIKKLEEKNISLQQITQVLQANNLTVPLGEVTLKNNKVPVLISGSINSIDQIKDLIVSPDSQVRISDLADVKIGKDSTVISRTNGKPSVAVNILKTSDSNTVDVSERIKEKFKLIQKNNNVEVIEVYDTSRDVKESVMSMAREGGLGALFTAILILFFLRNFRATIIAIISIPLSILVALILIKSFTDVTLNIMTLGGMAVATGRVVDDSIVVLENIIRRLQREKISKDMLVHATQEVGTAITSSTFTTVAVFAPLGLVTGIVGKVFTPFALTVAFSLLASLLVALTIVPLLVWMLLKKSTPKEHVEPAMSRVYKRVLNWSLDHKVSILVISVLIFLSSLPLVGIVGATFLPDTDYKYVFAELSMPAGTDLSVMDKKADEVDKLLRDHPDVVTSQVTVGASYMDPESNTKNMINWFIRLKTDSDTDQFIDDMKKKVKPGEGNYIEFFKFNKSSGIQILLSGGTKENLTQAAELVTEKVKKLKGTANVKNNVQTDTKGIEITVRKADALKNGLTVAQATESLRPFLSDVTIGKIGTGNVRSDLYLSLKGNTIASVDDLSNLSLSTPLGTKILVKDIADVKEVQLPETLQLRNSQEYVSVTGAITDKDANKVNMELASLMKKLKLPSGVKYELVGSNQDMQDMFSEMFMAMLVALGMVYIVMVIALGGGRAPFAILFSLPFALVGGLLGTLIAKQPISVSSLIGFLMLIGIVVTNAIVLIDRVQQQIEKGMTIREALLESGGTRLRPILMTAVATICALLPLALGLGGGTIISTGLAVIVIGGLTTSTLLTLVIVPVVYELLYFKQSRQERQRSAMAEKELWSAVNQ